MSARRKFRRQLARAGKYQAAAHKRKVLAQHICKPVFRTVVGGPYHPYGYCVTCGCEMRSAPNPNPR